MSASSYNKGAIIFHWVIAVLIISMLVGGKVMDNLPNGSLKFELFQWHKSFGILILLLSVGRLVWRLTHPVPALPEGMKDWEKKVAKLTHGLFYGLMLAIPIAGWLTVSASPIGIKTVLFKFIPWPHVPGVPQSEQLAGIFSETHEIMAMGIFVLLVLHIGAALKHHFKDKDDTLTRMIPSLKRKGS